MKEYLQEKEYYTILDDTISKKKETIDFINKGK